MSDANVSVVGSQQNLVPVSSRRASLKKRTRLEIRLLVVIAILVILLLIFLFVIIILACEVENNEPAKLQVLGLQGPACGNEKCIQSAYSILESIDRRVDPCEDFYEFACGNWGRAHPVSEAEISNTWFNERSQFLVRRLKDLLQENGTSSEPRAVKEAKFFFAACKDIDTLEDLGLEPIMEILGNLSLPRQIPDSKTAAGWDIATTLAKAQKLLSLDTLVQLGPDVDSSDNEKLILSLSPPTEARPLVGALVSDPEEMPRAARISNKEIVKARFSYMSGILGEMDAWGKTDDDTKHNDSYISAAVFKILIFSAEVSEGISEEVTNSSSNNNAKMTLSTLQSIMDFKIKDAKYKHKIIWKNYMTALLEGTGVSFDVDNDILSVTDVTYFLNLAVVISKSRLETVQRYVWWQVVHLLAIHTNKAMRNLRNQMLEQIFGSIDSPSRSTVCLKRVKKLMPMAISYTLASEEDVISTVSKVSEMMNDIRSSFNSLVRQEDWINPETKQAAQEKADAVTSFIGYQEWLLQPGKLDEHYADVKLVENQYLWNVIRIKSSEVESFLVQILDQTKSEKNDSWNDIDPLQVNAYYSRTENAIIIPAGILQFPFYDRGLEAMNYGSIGSILGHELTHGFDIEGKDYGKDGKKASWWNKDMLKAYEDRAQCFIKQYSNFGPTDNKVNGRRTLAENIADNGGIREAYWAYQKYKERHDPEPALPGLEEFTHDQLLFLAFANIWCLDEGPDYNDIATRDSHSPGRYRVLGSLSNSPEFAKSWNCPANSSMSPSKRCIIW